jgi:hypothetical protein
MASRNYLSPSAAPSTELRCGGPSSRSPEQRGNAVPLGAKGVKPPCRAGNFRGKAEQPKTQKKIGSGLQAGGGAARLAPSGAPRNHQNESSHYRAFIFFVYC